eukprot:scaffold97580_cov46-Prasinocladus_malaysianus.AAC.1
MGNNGISLAVECETGNCYVSTSGQQANDVVVCQAVYGCASSVPDTWNPPGGDLAGNPLVLNKSETRRLASVMNISKHSDRNCEVSAQGLKLQAAAQFPTARIGLCTSLGQVILAGFDDAQTHKHAVSFAVAHDDSAVVSTSWDGRELSVRQIVQHDMGEKLMPISQSQMHASEALAFGWEANSTDVLQYSPSAAAVTLRTSFGTPDIIELLQAVTRDRSSAKVLNVLSPERPPDSRPATRVGD